MSSRISSWWAAMSIQPWPAVWLPKEAAHCGRPCRGSSAELRLGHAGGNQPDGHISCGDDLGLAILNGPYF